MEILCFSNGEHLERSSSARGKEAVLRVQETVIAYGETFVVIFAILNYMSIKASLSGPYNREIDLELRRLLSQMNDYY